MAKKKHRERGGDGHSNSALRLASRLYPEDGEGQAKFLAALTSNEERPAFIWCGETAPSEALVAVDREGIPLTGNLSSLLVAADPEIQLGKTAEYREGLLYPLDLSSAILASAFSAVPQAPIILDLCASPGGKSVAAATLLKPRLLIANEVIKKRLGALVSNLERCQLRGAVVISLDPAECAERFESGCDLVIVDAPCSGQSLQRKGQVQAGAFMKHMISMNAKRQRRIITEGSRAVAPGGYLAYLTCTFSQEENEEVITRFLREAPNFEVVSVDHLDRLRSPYHGENMNRSSSSKRVRTYKPALAPESDLPLGPTYRIMPTDGLGAGGYVALLRRCDEGSERGEIVASQLPAHWRSRE